MPDLAWAVLCSQSFIDDHSNNVALVVLEQLNLGVAEGAQFPIKIPFRSDLVCMLVHDRPTEPVKAELRLRLLAPSGKVTRVTDPEIAELKELRTRVTFRGDSFTVEAAGVHYFHVQMKTAKSSKWITKAKIPLEISFSTIAVPPNVPVSEETPGASS
ncbi:MAG: hypothetical protein KC731_24440 [Myxococcales bacterium]|nr:hypothetical protein [Myxococcales bacterium]